MTVEELMNFMAHYPKCAKIQIAAANFKERTGYYINGAGPVDVEGRPTIYIDIGGEVPFDEEQTAMAEECERAAEDAADL